MTSLSAFANPRSLATGAFVLVLFVKGTQWLTKRRTPRLRGPKGTSLVFGIMKELLGVLDPGVYYDKWINQYGAVYEIPSILRRKNLVVADPKAIASLFSKDTFSYHQLAGARVFVKNFFGENLLVNEGADHKRQRRALSTAFSNAAIRGITPVFMNAANQVKAAWENAIDASANDYQVIEVQQWMNNVALDSVGLGGFSHDFGTLRGNKSAIQDAFELFSDLKLSFAFVLSFLLCQLFPPLAKLPTKRAKIMHKLSESVRNIALELFRKAKEEKDITTEKSIIGSLVTLTYALIELARHPHVLAKLRAELSQFAGTNATYEQLTSGLPYLDAVTNEVLRLDPPGPELERQAEEDDILPLTEPITDRNGNTMDSIFIAKGTLIRIPISSVNRLESLWGSDSKTFNPDRWLDDNLERTAEISGYRHLLTFGDGPRTCLGRAFALTEFKAVLSVLARDFTFELPGGADTKLELNHSILPRPKLAGEQGSRVPLIIRRATH